MLSMLKRPMNEYVEHINSWVRVSFKAPYYIWLRKRVFRRVHEGC